MLDSDLHWGSVCYLLFEKLISLLLEGLSGVAMDSREFEGTGCLTRLFTKGAAGFRRIPDG
uniref:Uncharacterized protein n=1 Tax=Heterorhabditis bacteriophora TaxID=37862 RepID=A0A1I7XPB8_HETBA